MSETQKKEKTSKGQNGKRRQKMQVSLPLLLPLSLPRLSDEPEGGKEEGCNAPEREFEIPRLKAARRGSPNPH
jgi:hypothetical protein